jgi:hypothetical protein
MTDLTKVMLMLALWIILAGVVTAKSVLHIQKETIKMYNQNNYVGDFEQQPLNELTTKGE